ILAALYRGDMTTVKANQKERGRWDIAAGTELDLRAAVIETKCHGHFLAVTSREAERMLDIRAVGTNSLPLPVDNDLRRVDRAGIERGGLMILAFGGLTAGIGVFPPEPIPVIDMERQRQHIGTVRELGEQLVGWRA